MKMSRILTEEESALRAELQQLVDRINLKIRKITWTHQKLPYERLTKGRSLKERALAAIFYLDQGKEYELRNCIHSLEQEGITMNSNPWKEKPRASN